MTVPQLWRLLTGFSRLRPGFDPKARIYGGGSNFFFLFLTPKYWRFSHEYKSTNATYSYSSTI